MSVLVSDTKPDTDTLLFRCLGCYVEFEYGRSNF